MQAAKWQASGCCWKMSPEYVNTLAGDCAQHHHTPNSWIHSQANCDGGRVSHREWIWYWVNPVHVNTHARDHALISNNPNEVMNSRTNRTRWNELFQWHHVFNIWLLSVAFGLNWMHICGMYNSVGMATKISGWFLNCNPLDIRMWYRCVALLHLQPDCTPCERE